MTRIADYGLNLPAQPTMSEEAERYGAESLRRSRAVLARVRHRLAIPYGEHPRQRLDVFLPPEGSPSGLPVLLFLHGGGWTNGYREWCGFMAPAITAQPAILVSASYRLIPEVRFPLPVGDALAALAWVRSHAAELGGSPERVFIGGHSAGGQIAALVAIGGVDGKLPDAQLPRACFSVSATFNRRMVSPAIAPDHVAPGAPEAIQPDSPIALAGQARVPFLITWGSIEEARMPRSGHQMSDALAAAGCTVETRVYPGRGHFDMHLDLEDPAHPAVRRMADWMRDPPPLRA